MKIHGQSKRLKHNGDLLLKYSEETRKRILEELRDELQVVSELLKQVEKSLENAPDGRLRTAMARGKFPQYYIVREDERAQYPNGRFMRKEEKEVAKVLAQKEYEIKMKRLLETQKKTLEKFLKEYPAQEWKEVLQSMPPAKRLLVSSCVITDEEFQRRWEMEHCGQQNTYPINDGFLTEGKEAVRSKSEKIIADKLRYEGIPYRYEAQLFLPDGKVVYPDFTILNTRTRKTYYLEHFGMMDDPDYCRKSLMKVERYERNGIFHGEQLLITMESSKKSLDTVQIQKLIERYFC